MASGLILLAVISEVSIEDTSVIIKYHFRTKEITFEQIKEVRKDCIYGDAEMLVIFLVLQSGKKIRLNNFVEGDDLFYDAITFRYNAFREKEDSG